MPHATPIKTLQLIGGRVADERRAGTKLASGHRMTNDEWAQFLRLSARYISLICKWQRRRGVVAYSSTTGNSRAQSQRGLRGLPSTAIAPVADWLARRPVSSCIITHAETGTRRALNSDAQPDPAPGDMTA